MTGAVLMTDGWSAWTITQTPYKLVTDIESVEGIPWDPKQRGRLTGQIHKTATVMSDMFTSGGGLPL